MTISPRRLRLPVCPPKRPSGRRRPVRNSDVISPSLSELREKRRRALHSSPVSPSLKVEREGRADGHYFLQEIFDTLIFLERILSQTLKNKKEEDYYFSTSNRWGFSATDERRRQNRLPIFTLFHPRWISDDINRKSCNSNNRCSTSYSGKDDRICKCPLVSKLF